MMKTMIMITAVALLSLGACQQAAREDADDEAAASDSAEDESTEAESDSGGKAGGDGGAEADFQSASAGDDGLSTQLVGGWTDNGDCNDTIEMRDDNTFQMSGGGEGTWVLNGDTLTMGGPAGRNTLTVAMDGDDVMLITHADGSLGRSTRCW